jgi:predicted GH43/DUF377 family glycosyl hydrolase
LNAISIRRHDIKLQPESSRVILRPFIPSDARRIATILGRALALTEAEVQEEMAGVRRDFCDRHLDIDALLLQTYALVKSYLFTQRPLSRDRELLIGALFSGEYALESAALFNPSIVAHPDQSGVPEGGLRFLMSLRAAGEGHISSIEFREGCLSPEGDITITPTSRFVSLPEILPNPSYEKYSFTVKLHEMGFDNECSDDVLGELGDQFTRSDLLNAVGHARRRTRPLSSACKVTLEGIQWLADSNYELLFPSGLAPSERIIFPVSANESNGIEDARFVRFVEDDGSVLYYATYTAYNGHTILPQFIETKDFLRFRMLTLNGDAVQNKGMALFPRRINHRYAMLSRQDDENLFIMFSDYPHHWNDPQVLIRPAEAWESVKVGNCGSPIETEAGWLVITHGVGPMRRYCIGAVLLDLEDPTRVIGRLHEPLLVAEGIEREGYVPNVVYSCGSMVHSGTLILPYAMSDRFTSIASIPLAQVLERISNSSHGD